MFLQGYGRNGLLGKGITATMGRNGTFNMIYFGFYHSVREYIPVLEDPWYPLIQSSLTIRGN